MYEIDLLKLSEFFKNEIIVEQRKKIKELEKKLDIEQQHNVKLLMALENDCKSREELEKENEELHKINKANAKSYEKFWYKLEKYKQTLKEIKEIAEKEIACDDCNFQGTGECASSCPSFYLDDFCKSLLQKISEVFDVRI